MFKEFVFLMPALGCFYAESTLTAFMFSIPFLLVNILFYQALRYRGNENMKNERNMRDALVRWGKRLEDEALRKTNIAKKREENIQI